MGGERRGSVEVFEGIWQNYLSGAEEPEFNAQERLFAERKNEALARILPPAPARVLECGSGSGEVAAWMAANGYEVVLLDASPSALAFAEKRFQREGLTGEFVLGNVYDLPFEEESFDILTSFGLLEHFEDVDVVIAEMTRVLRPGGLFFADIVTERLSVQTIGNVFNAAVRLLYFTFKRNPSKGRWKQRRSSSPTSTRTHIQRRPMSPLWNEADFQKFSYGETDRSLASPFPVSPRKRTWGSCER